jgi:2-oxoisovalerate dehydrogenase E1 component
MKVKRLSDHTNAGDEKIYRSPAELAQRLSADPVANMRQHLLKNGCRPSALNDLEEQLEQQIVQALALALALALATPAPQTETSSKKILHTSLSNPACEYWGDGSARYTLSEAIRETLRAQLATDSRVTLYGEDIEDPKGDVFGITRGLSTAFAGRVCNSTLSESTIVGCSIGRAMAGERPVAFLQFADFLPLAFNQIVSELATIYWRSNGDWQAPVLLLVSCGGYRPGLGPFHAQSFDSTLAHCPGIDTAVISGAADAAGIINAAIAGGRPTVVFYPKALLSDRSRMTSADVHRQLVPIGLARACRQGNDLTLLAWGNTLPIAERVADALSNAGASCYVLDLRWLSPWDKSAVIESVKKPRRLLVVHEDNLSAGFTAEVLASVAQKLGNAEGRPLTLRRICRLDTFARYNFGNQLEVFPSFKSTLTVAAQMLEMDLKWILPAAAKENQLVVTAHGSSPSDQTVVVVKLDVAVGDTVRAGQIIASLEADKAVVDVSVPADGLVEAVHLSLGDSVMVDSPLVTLRINQARMRQPSSKSSGQPVLAKRVVLPTPIAAPAASDTRGIAKTVVIQGISTCPGHLRLTNAQLGPRFPQLGGATGIFERTGIKERFLADASQTAVSMAVDAVKKLLSSTQTEAKDLSLIICSTTTPVSIAPSTACSVLHKIAPGAEIPAYDVLAACSGYLYALSNAWDFLQTHPVAKVLVLTAETMRRITDIDDANTSPVFGDAASATLLSTDRCASTYWAVLEQPVLSALGDSGAALNVPLTAPNPPIHMDGKHIFSEATRKMESIHRRVCAKSGLTVDEFDFIVPHQANGRIIEAMRMKLALPKERIVDVIEWQGNTSSSSIPLALEELFKTHTSSAQKIGLCAFGSGFTFAGAILRRMPD